ncbi:MAG: hypothetical protein LUC91_02010, partial [Prevotella sp.]|nr:hypothetical protein [Prevotella sp.]
MICINQVAQWKTLTHNDDSQNIEKRERKSAGDALLSLWMTAAMLRGIDFYMVPNLPFSRLTASVLLAIR